MMYLDVTDDLEEGFMSILVINNDDVTLCLFWLSAYEFLLIKLMIEIINDIKQTSRFITDIWCL